MLVMLMIMVPPMDVDDGDPVLSLTFIHHLLVCTIFLLPKKSEFGHMSHLKVSRIFLDWTCKTRPMDKREPQKGK